MQYELDDIVMGKVYGDQMIALECYFVCINHTMKEQKGTERVTDD